MGAPSQAFFCSNGHLCLSTCHHEIPPFTPKSCWCGSKQIYTQFEWGDTDYPQFVDSRWLYYGWHWDKRNEKMVKFFVYDVSKLIKNYNKENK